MASQLTLFGDSMENTKSTRRSCCQVHVLLTRVSRFWRCGQFFPSPLSAFWVLSVYFLAVLRIRLLTRVYRTMYSGNMTTCRFMWRFKMVAVLHANIWTKSTKFTSLYTFRCALLREVYKFVLLPHGQIVQICTLLTGREVYKCAHSCQFSVR